MELYKKITFAFCVFILGAASLFYIYSNKLNYPVIRSDGEGYYAYLPALFLFCDISLQNQVAGPFSDHIPKSWSLWPGTQKYLIRYPCGEAILLSPFFLIGYSVAYFTDSSLNGYSPPFQTAAAISGLFYTVIGLLLLWSVLRKYFKTNTVLMVLVAILFGTPLFHYATYDAIFSHAYSFFLFSIFLFFVERIYRINTFRNCIALGIISGLIVITRPTNAIWLIFGFAFGIHTFRDVIARLKIWKLYWIKSILLLLVFLAVVSIQLIYWKTITGSFIIYSYDQGSFNFSRPEIGNVLFSVRKGLFFWSPILLTVIPGIYYVRKLAKEYFLPILIFLPLNIYIISSWSFWWYGGSFGQRPFVESLPLFAITLCALYEGIYATIGKRVLHFLISSACILSIWLMLKYWHGSIASDETNWEYFTDNFFKI